MRQGENVLVFENKPSVVCWSSVVGKKEAEGPLSAGFDLIIDDIMAGQESWELAESYFQRTSIGILLKKSGIKPENADVLFAGDLLNQCSGTGYGIRDFNIPFSGVYGACSTSVLSIINAAIGVNSGIFKTAIASTSSHFCSAEKQFRQPLEYGGQRTPTSQWTVTGASASLIAENSNSSFPKIEKAIIGKIVDKGVSDPNNMGAAMAPAAAQTIADFLNDTKTSPTDYDLILTGDLGKVGSKLLYELLENEFKINIRDIHNDAGMMIYYLDEQDVHSGGSGCACCGAVLCSKIFNDLHSGKLNKVLVVATGALLSSISTLQGETIPSIAHGILLTGGDVKNE